MNLANEIDDRTVKEQLRDLGVQVVRRNTNTVTGVKWAKRGAHKKLKPPAVTISTNYIYFNVTAVTAIKPDRTRYEIGVGDYKNQKVLLMREGEGGYKASVKKDDKKGAVINSISLAGWLIDKGLKPGRYELVKLEKVQGGYMGVPAE